MFIKFKKNKRKLKSFKGEILSQTKPNSSHLSRDSSLRQEKILGGSVNGKHENKSLFMNILAKT